MAASWKGHLQLSLVSIPVAAVSANNSTARPHFHQVHAECNNRIRYKKTCPVHGEIPNDEIVSAYEPAKGQFVLFDKAELAELKGDRERALNIEAIVTPGLIGPLFFTDRSYYLIPDGKTGEKPYALLRECLKQGKLEAICHGVLYGGEELSLLRADGDLLTLTALKFDAEVREPSELNAPKDVPLRKEELALTKTLLDNYRNDDFDIANYADHFAEQVAKLVELKVKGKKIIHSAPVESPRIINLMDALKKSLAVKKASTKQHSSVPKRKRKSG
jgi:DNA end-binding protein Ku